VLLRRLACDASIGFMSISYAEALQAQLGDYKRHELVVTVDGLWAQNSRPYPHILAVASSDLNL
jgi:hypothetical protein